MFLESPRFPDDIARGALGGPGYSTDIVVVNSGAEYRNQNWSLPLSHFDVSHGVKSETDALTLLAFFRIVKGRAHGFRFRDFLDHSVSGSDGRLVQLTSTTWQMYKRYTSGSQTEDRIIQKPVSGSIAVSGSGSYTIDTTTGIITKTSGADPTGWTGDFDVPCRFDIDLMKMGIVSKGLYNWESIPIVEIRL